MQISVRRRVCWWTAPPRIYRRSRSRNASGSPVGSLFMSSGKGLDLISGVCASFASVLLSASPSCWIASRGRATVRASRGPFIFRRDGRAVEGARLESVCRATYRGFESHSLRHLVCCCRDCLAPSTEIGATRRVRADFRGLAIRESTGDRDGRAMYGDSRRDISGADFGG